MGFNEESQFFEIKSETNAYGMLSQLFWWSQQYLYAFSYGIKYLQFASHYRILPMKHSSYNFRNHLEDS